MPRHDTELMTREQAAEFLGVSVGTLAAWATDNRYNLPFIRVGRLVRYRRTDLDEWLRLRTVDPVDKDDEEASS